MNIRSTITIILSLSVHLSIYITLITETREKKIKSVPKFLLLILYLNYKLILQKVKTEFHQL